MVLFISIDMLEMLGVSRRKSRDVYYGRAGSTAVVGTYKVPAKSHRLCRYLPHLGISKSIPQ